MSAKHIQNPAWDYVETVPDDKIYAGLFQTDVRTPAGVEYDIEDLGGTLLNHRGRVTSTWTWAIPNPTVLDFIVEELHGRAIVEIGAGNGYWAWLLTQLGVDVNAYDIAPLGHKDSWFDADEAYARARIGGDWTTLPVEHHPVIKMGCEAVELPENHDRALLLCWPNYDTNMAVDALTAFKGDLLFYIGEGRSGCNANEGFFELLDKEWDAHSYHSMIQWSGLHDNLHVYKRKAS